MHRYCPGTSGLATITQSSTQVRRHRPPLPELSGDRPIHRGSVPRLEFLKQQPHVGVALHRGLRVPSVEPSQCIARPLPWPATATPEPL